nr:response regulator [uncultured Thiodictyon sp.]
MVDDMPTNIKVLLSMLDDDSDVRVATSGREALNFLAKGQPPPDLIVLDVMMPEMDGYQVCATLKGQVATRDVPVIAVTAMVSMRVSPSGMAATVTGSTA